MRRKNKSEYVPIQSILNDLKIPQSDIALRMYVIATNQELLHLDGVGWFYDDIEELLLDHYNVVNVLGSWREHIRDCIEKYEIDWFKSIDNCRMFYLSYSIFYQKVQDLALKETGVKIK